MTNTLDLMRVVNRMAIPVAAPDRILVVPWGMVESRNRSFVIDEVSAASIVQAFEEQGVDLPIDFEHTTVGGPFTSPDGAAPAMGWIKALEVVPGEGIWAQVEWTERGAEFVRSKEYRYLSPTLLIRPSTESPKALHSVALTNKPAIVGQRPIVNRAGVNDMIATFTELGDWIAERLNAETEDRTVADLAKAAGVSEATMGDIIGGRILRPPDERLSAIAEFFNVSIDTVRGLIPSDRLDQGADAQPSDASTNKEFDMNRIVKVLGLSDGADEAACETAIRELAALRLTACKAAGLDEAASTDAIVSAMRSMTPAATPQGRPDPTEFVPMSEHKALAEDVAALRKQNRALEFGGFVQKAREEGRCDPKSEERLKTIYMEDPTKARAVIEMIPPDTYPHAGRATAGKDAAAAGGGRASVIASARAEFEAERRLIACSERAYVNEALREQGEAALSEKELSVISCQ